MRSLLTVVLLLGAWPTSEWLRARQLRREASWSRSIAALGRATSAAAVAAPSERRAAVPDGAASGVPESTDSSRRRRSGPSGAASGAPPSQPNNNATRSAMPTTHAPTTSTMMNASPSQPTHAGSGSSGTPQTVVR
jgi:hypothetical protein